MKASGRVFWFVLMFAIMCMPVVFILILTPIVGGRALEDGPLRPIIIVGCMVVFLALLPSAIRSEVRAQKSDPFAVRVNEQFANAAGALGGVFIGPKPEASSPYGEVTARLPEGVVHIENQTHFSREAWNTWPVLRLTLADPIRARFVVEVRVDRTPQAGIVIDDEALAQAPEPVRHFVQEILQRWAARLSVDKTAIVCECRPWHAMGMFQTAANAPDRIAETVDVAHALGRLARALTQLELSQWVALVSPKDVQRDLTASVPRPRFVSICRSWIDPSLRFAIAAESLPLHASSIRLSRLEVSLPKVPRSLWELG